MISRLSKETFLQYYFLFCILILTKAFTWIYTGQGAYILDESTSVGMQVYSNFSYLVIASLLWVSWKPLLLQKKFRLVLLAFSYFLLTALWAFEPKESVRMSISVLFQIILAIAITLHVPWERTMDRLVFIAKGLLVINIAFALSFSTLAVEPGYFDGAYSGALRGIFSSKNALGSIIAVAYAILFIDLLQTPKRYKFIPFLWLCAAMIILVLTQSATAIIAALFTTMIGTVSSAEWFLRSKQVTRLTFLLFLFFIFGLLASLIEPILGLLGRDLTLTGRSFLWLYAYENIQLKPIFGHGLNSFWREMLSKNQLVEVGLWNIGQAHNGFIDAFLSGGIVGGLIIIAVYLKMLAVLIKEITKQPISTRLTELLVFYWLALVQNLTETSFPYSMRLTGVIITLFFILHASRYEEDNIEG